MTEELVQLRPCMDFEDNQVVQCCVADADYFGVYYGGPGDLQWQADFADYGDARNFAEQLAASAGCDFDDLVEREVAL